MFLGTSGELTLMIRWIRQGKNSDLDCRLWISELTHDENLSDRNPSVSIRQSEIEDLY
jgi:hypothetical protein